MNIEKFLLERIEEDEQDARAIAGSVFFGVESSAEEEVIRLSDPKRVLAECEAKRRIIQSVEVLTEGEKSYAQRLRHTDVEDACYQITRDILYHFAAVYADHPDYDPSWKIE